MLGSSFFQEMTSGKREKSLKTYDSTAFVAEEDNDEEPDWSWNEEYMDEENLEALAQDDPDAALVVQFEAAIQDVIQDDQDLSAFFLRIPRCPSETPGSCESPRLLEWWQRCLRFQRFQR